MKNTAMKQLGENYWSSLYENNDTGWDAKQITPPLKEYIDQLTDKNLSILIPGCGNSHEAAYLLQQGFTNITLIDISSVLCTRLEQLFQLNLNKEIKIVCANFFELEGQFDLILEQTFFCALDPSLRESYVGKMHQLLKPGGKLVGVLFNRSFEDNPPFGGDATEYRQLFEPFFEIVIMETCYNSIDKRKGAELFIHFRNKN